MTAFLSTPLAFRVVRGRAARKCYLARSFPVFPCMSSSSSAPAPDDNADDTTTSPAHTGGETRAPHALIVKLVKWRTAKRWTQEKAAERLKIPLNTLRGYECGNRNPGGANTEKILALLGLLKK